MNQSTPEFEILDISSDEEAVPKAADYDWLSELLEDDDRIGGSKGESSTEDYDSDDHDDDVVVVAEFNPRPPRPTTKKKSKDSWKLTAKSVNLVDDHGGDVDEDDGDCVVLDGDPDQSEAAVNDDAGRNDSDDVVVVGQKGQIACKDYPHPRHHCATFPFSSTRHERHCEQCHCYVCDSLAPCAHWGTGISSIDHCHATDKEEIWRVKRKSFKLAKDVPIQASITPDTSPSMIPSQLNQVPPCNIIRLTPSSMQQTQVSRLTAIPRNQVSRPTVIRACSSMTKHGIPNIINQDRSQQSAYIKGRNGFHTHPVFHQSLGVRNNVIRRDRGHNIVNLSSQFTSSTSNTIVKRPVYSRATLVPNQSACGSNNTGCHGFSRNLTPPVISNATESIGWQGDCHSMNSSNLCQNSSNSSLGSGVANTMTYPPLFSQPVPQSSEDSDFYHPRSPSEILMDPGYSAFSHSWLNNSSQSNQQPPFDNFQLQDPAPTNEPLPVKGLSSPFNASVRLHCKEVESENWMLDNQSPSVVSEGFVAAELNVLSPEPAPFDAGLLSFDFESAWNGLTHA